MLFWLGRRAEAGAVLYAHRSRPAPPEVGGMLQAPKPRAACLCLRPQLLKCKENVAQGLQ